VLHIFGQLTDPFIALAVKGHNSIAGLRAIDRYQVVALFGGGADL
jgi:hypothetical protein